MKKIFISKSDFILVSGEDYLYLVKYTWTINDKKHLQTRIAGKIQFMHRIIAERMGLNIKNKYILHIDGNFLNNQRDNLISVTRSQSQAGRCRPRNNTSGYKGVGKSGRGWRAVIRVNKRLIHLGCFDSATQAYVAYCEAAEHYFGEFANSHI